MSILTEIVELAKQGYSISDIKEAYNLAKEDGSGAEAGKKEEPQKEEPKEPEEKSGDPAADPEPGPDPKPAEDPEPDYKTLYENLLKEKQENFIRQNNADENIKSLDEQVTNILGSFIGGK